MVPAKQEEEAAPAPADDDDDTNASLLILILVVVSLFCFFKPSRRGVVLSCSSLSTCYTFSLAGRSDGEDEAAVAEERGDHQ